jgi:hypothetical protein
MAVDSRAADGLHEEVVAEADHRSGGDSSHDLLRDWVHLSLLREIARKCSPAQEVRVEVEDGLSRVRTLVNHHSVAVCESQLSRDFLGGVEQVLVVSGFWEFGESGDLGFRDDQNVHRSLRVDVADREDVFVLENDLAGDFAETDFCKQCGHSARLPFNVHRECRCLFA